MTQQQKRPSPEDADMVERVATAIYERAVQVERAKASAAGASADELDAFVSPLTWAELKEIAAPSDIDEHLSVARAALSVIPPAADDLSRVIAAVEAENHCWTLGIEFTGLYAAKIEGQPWYYGPTALAALTAAAQAAGIEIPAAPVIPVQARWRPFATAPIDGTVIHCWREDVGVVFTAHFCESEADDGKCYWFTTDGEDLTRDLPTLWQPLPVAPGAAPVQQTPDVVSFHYTNWRGERSARHARSIGLRWGTSEWHPDPQWLWRAYDIDRGEEREFAVKDMRPIGGLAPVQQDDGDDALMKRLASTRQDAFEIAQEDVATATTLPTHELWDGDQLRRDIIEAGSARAARLQQELFHAEGQVATLTEAVKKVRAIAHQSSRPWVIRFDEIDRITDHVLTPPPSAQIAALTAERDKARTNGADAFRIACDHEAIAKQAIVERDTARAEQLEQISLTTKAVTELQHTRVKLDIALAVSVGQNERIDRLTSENTAMRAQITDLLPQLDADAFTISDMARQINRLTALWRDAELNAKIEQGANDGYREVIADRQQSLAAAEQREKVMREALVTIRDFPITDPTRNMDASNMRLISLGAFTALIYPTAAVPVAQREIEALVEAAIQCCIQDGSRRREALGRLGKALEPFTPLAASGPITPASTAGDHHGEMSFWVSWWHDPSAGFEYDGPWWVSGERADGYQSVCAAVRAIDDGGAIETILQSYDDRPLGLDLRFCEEKPMDWLPFSGRFPRAPWMKWNHHG